MLLMQAFERACLITCIHLKGQSTQSFLIDVPQQLTLYVYIIDLYNIYRGQVLPAASLLNSVSVDLIYEGVKYCLKVPALFLLHISCLTQPLNFF